MGKTKTILEWLNEIEEPEIREAAIKLYDEPKFARQSVAILHAIDLVSLDENSKYNAEFWINYINKLIQQGK